MMIILMLEKMPLLIKMMLTLFRFTAMRATLERHPATRLGKLMRAASIAKVVAKVLSCIGKVLERHCQGGCQS